MKQLVLDTHALVWYLEDNQKLSREARKEIDDVGNRNPIDLDILSELATNLSIHDAIIVATAKVFHKSYGSDGGSTS